MLIDPDGNVLLKSTGRWLASLERPSPPTATVVVGFVQHIGRPPRFPLRPTPPDQPMPEQPLLHPTPLDQPAPDQQALYQSPLQPAPPDQPASIVRHRHGRPTAACWRSFRGYLRFKTATTVQKIGQREVGSFKGGVQTAEGGQHITAFHFSLVHPASHGEKGRWQLASLQRFPLAQPFAVGCTVYSKIELRKEYHQIPVNPEDVQKTAITTLFGLFEYKQMPLGLRNAGSSFLRHMDQAIRLCLRNAGTSFQGCVDRAIRDCHAAFAIYSRNHK